MRFDAHIAQDQDEFEEKYLIKYVYVVAQETDYTLHNFAP